MHLKRCTSNFNMTLQKSLTKTKLLIVNESIPGTLLGCLKNYNNLIRNFDISLLHRGPLILT